jgi:hypothetical protein
MYSDQPAIGVLFQDLYEKFISFLPNLITALVVLLLGLALGKLVKIVFPRLFRAVGVDKVSEMTGMKELLHKGGVKRSVSELLPMILQWLIIVIFVTVSLDALNIRTVNLLLQRFFLYLPNVFVALLIVIFGYILSNFLERSCLIACVNSGISHSGAVARLVKFNVFILSVAMALEQLGIARMSVIAAYCIIFGGVVLALALAFGLGAKDVIHKYLEEKIKSDREKDDIEHI